MYDISYKQKIDL